MRAVLTGCAGFIGSRFAEMFLLEAEELGVDDIVVLDALTYSGRRENLSTVLTDPRVRFVEGSIVDPAVVDATLDGAELVVHFAAESHVDRSIESAWPFFETNVLGTVRLLEAARRGVGHFVHVSTDEVYGSIATGSWREDHLLEPNSPYSSSKAGSDLAALAYFTTHAVPVTLTRCSNNYGPRQFPEKFIPLALTNLLEGRPVPVYGDGGNVRDWLHVDDHCRALLRVVADGRPGEIYNIGGGTELTNRELAERLITAVGANPDAMEFVDDRLGHDRRYSVDWTKIRDELGYRPMVDFDEGLVATVEWYRDNEWWWRPLRGTK